MHKKSNSTRRSLFVSGVSLVLIVVLLAATTFAWFTDVVKNEGNKIQAGTLAIEVVAWKWDATADGGAGAWVESLVTDKIIDVTNIKPDDADSVYIQVRNVGTIDAWAKWELGNFVLMNDPAFDGTNQYGTVRKYGGGDISDVLYLDWEDMGASFDPSAAPAPSFTDADKLAIDVNLRDIMSAGSAVGKIDVVEGGKSYWYRVDYKMDKGAGNAYQNAGFSADLFAYAAQYNAPEADIILVNDNAQFFAMMQSINNVPKGSTLIFTSDIDLTVVGEGFAWRTQHYLPACNIVLNDHTVKFNGTLTFNGQDQYGTIDIDPGVLKGNTLTFAGCDNVAVNVYGDTILDFNTINYPRIWNITADASISQFAAANAKIQEAFNDPAVAQEVFNSAYGSDPNYWGFYTLNGDGSVTVDNTNNHFTPPIYLRDLLNNVMPDKGFRLKLDVWVDSALNYVEFYVPVRNLTTGVSSEQEPTLWRQGSVWNAHAHKDGSPAVAVSITEDAYNTVELVYAPNSDGNIAITFYVNGTMVSQNSQWNGGGGTPIAYDNALATSFCPISVNNRGSQTHCGSVTIKNLQILAN